MTNSREAVLGGIDENEMWGQGRLSKETVPSCLPGVRGNSAQVGRATEMCESERKR